MRSLKGTLAKTATILVKQITCAAGGTCLHDCCFYIYIHFCLGQRELLPRRNKGIDVPCLAPPISRSQHKRKDRSGQTPRSHCLPKSIHKICHATPFLFMVIGPPATVTPYIHGDTGGGGGVKFFRIAF
jgi:hypothetical protein